MKKILLLILLIPAILVSQDLSNLQNKKLNDLNDTELLNYWKQAQKNGYDLDQIKLLARAQGVSELEINEFEKRINNLNISNIDSKENLFELSSLTSIFGNNTDQDDKNEISLSIDDLPVFGSNFFNNKNINPAPKLNIATPSSYELGPGDEILISIWGAAENEYSSLISREGFVRIERIGPIYVSGLTISEAKDKFKRSLSKIYSGLNFSDNSSSKVFLDLSLVNSRSIVINVMGNVIAPDTYTISSLASPLNVLYSAGGPNESGSYRNIKVIRNGKEILKIDLYDYFTSGKLDPFSLRDQDIIFVPSYENRIFVRGEFKNIGLFETNQNENILDLLRYTGGIKPFGVKDRLFIKSSDGLNRKISDIQENEFSNFILNNGDIVEARALTEKYNNMATIEGAVSIPGDYSISNIQNIKQLILKAGGLREDAINRAYLLRKSNGIESEIISFEISNSDNLFLKNEDRLIISSNIDINRSKNVSIRGEVFNPDTYSFFKGMTLIDLILIAKGLTLEGDLNNIFIYRSTLDEDRKNPVETIKVSLGSDLQNTNQINNINLEENDLVIVRKKLGIQEKEIISVDGLVKFPGEYNIKDNKYSFYDLISDFGGFLDDANLDGVKIIRSPSFNTNSITDNPISNFQETIEIGVNVKKIIESNGTNPNYNIILKSSDKIVVPRIDNTVEVLGAVQQAAAITYANSLSTISAINKAGGFSENANKKDVYVVYQNGNIKSTKSFLFFNNYPKLKAGSRVIVPEKKIQKNKTSVGEIVGYTTSLVSIIALIKSL